MRLLLQAVGFFAFFLVGALISRSFGWTDWGVGRFLLLAGIGTAAMLAGAVVLRRPDKV